MGRTAGLVNTMRDFKGPKIISLKATRTQEGVRVATEQKTYTRSPSDRADPPKFGPHGSSRGFCRVSLPDPAISSPFPKTPVGTRFAGRRFLNGLMQKNRTAETAFCSLFLLSIKPGFVGKAPNGFLM